jgi:hypothetical protein
MEIIFFSKKYPGLEVFELIRYSHIFYPKREDVVASADDLLLTKGLLSDLVGILQDKILELPYTSDKFSFDAMDDKSLIVEIIIPPQSDLVGEKVSGSELQRDPDFHIIANKRSY